MPETTSDRLDQLQHDERSLLTRIERDTATLATVRQRIADEKGKLWFPLHANVTAHGLLGTYRITGYRWAEPNPIALASSLDTRDARVYRFNVAGLFFTPSPEPIL